MRAKRAFIENWIDRGERLANVCTPRAVRAFSANGCGDVHRARSAPLSENGCASRAERAFNEKWMRRVRSAL